MGNAAASSWKKQAAIFAAIVSAVTGLGIVVVVWFTSHSTPDGAVKKTASSELAHPK